MLRPYRSSDKMRYLTVNVPVIVSGWTSQRKKKLPGAGVVNSYSITFGPVMISPTKIFERAVRFV